MDLVILASLAAQYPLPTITLNDEVVLQICDHASYTDLTSLSLVSRQWRRAAQSILYRSVNFMEPDALEGWGGRLDCRPAVTLDSTACMEQLYWFDRTLTSSPRLGICVREFAYAPLPGHYTFETFARIMYALKQLERLSFTVYEDHVLDPKDARRYRALFNLLSFEYLVIQAAHPDCIMYVPPRNSLAMLILRCGPDPRYLSPVNSRVDLSTFKINVIGFLISGCKEDYTCGLGSTFKSTSEMLASCLQRPRIFCIKYCDISPYRFYKLMEVIGERLFYLYFVPGRVCNLEVVDPVASSANDEYGADGVDIINDKTVAPKLVILYTTSISRSITMLHAVKHLVILLYTTLPFSILSDLVNALSRDCWPALRFLNFASGYIASLIQLPTSVLHDRQAKIAACLEHQRQLLKLEAVVRQRHLELSPANIIQMISAGIDARIVLYSDHQDSIDHAGVADAAI